LVFHFEISTTWSYQMKKILVTAFVACTVGLAFAESGQFETVSAGTVTVATNDFGNSKYSITNTTYTSSVINSNVSFFKVGSISVSQCLGTITIENSNASGGGSCLATNSDGDKWRLNYVRVDGTPQSVTGTAEMIGLTGKFVNVKGSCNYDQKRLVKDGLVHVTTLLKCSVSK
jgi:hypothetical protein